MIIKEFNNEIRQKRLIASGVHGRTGRRGYVGKMLFPSDFMNRKEKRQYMKSGVVKVSNIYDTIIDFDSFKNLSKEDKKKYLSEYRKRFSNKEIMKIWGISHNYYYKIIHDLDLPKAPRTRRAITKKTTQVTPIVPEVVGQVNPVIQPAKIMVELGDGLNVQLNGEYDGEKLIKKLEKIAILLEESTKYSVKLVISENE
jgi:hypothetical protein